MLLLFLTLSAFSRIFFTSKATFSSTTASTEYVQTTSTVEPIHGEIYFSQLMSNDETPNPPGIGDLRSKRQVECVCSYYHDDKNLQATINGIKTEWGAILLRVGETALLSCVNSSMNLVWPNGACASAILTCNVCRRFNANDIPFCLASRMDTDINCIRYPDEDVNMLNIDYEDKDIRVGSRATFSCQDSNQRLNGTSSTVCLRSGEWSSPPPQCMVTEEFSWNPAITTSSKAENSSSRQLEDCFCTYNSINWYLFASVDLRKLENGGLVKKGDTVRLDCRYSSMYIVWPNGMINRYYAEMTCDKCQTWGSKELPSCTNIVKGDSFIGLDGTMNVLPGGAVESQRGKNLKIACFSESDYPHWNYSYSKERLEVTYNHAFSRYFSFLNIPGFSGKHAYSFECSTERSFLFPFPPSNFELRLTEKCSAEPPEIPHGKFHYESRDLNSKVEYECDPGYEISGQSTVKCHHGEWSGQPPDCVKVEEVSWNPVTDAYPATEESNLGEPANCRCMYYPYSPFGNMLLVATVDEKKLKHGDRVKKGDTVQLACEYSFMHFLWPNGMRTLTAGMTCDVCQPWGVKELPTCTFNETGHTYVALDGTMKVQPGGVVECQSGKKLNIACFSEEVHPEWHTSNVKERLDKTRNDTSSRYFSILNIAHFSEKYAKSYECIAKRPFLSLSYRPTRLELRLTGTPRCLPPEISPGSKLVIIPQKTFFYIGETVSFLCPVGQKLNPETRRMTCFKRRWSKETLPECVEIEHKLL